MQHFCRLLSFRSLQLKINFAHNLYWLPANIYLRIVAERQSWKLRSGVLYLSYRSTSDPASRHPGCLNRELWILIPDLQDILSHNQNNRLPQQWTWMTWRKTIVVSLLWCAVYNSCVREWERFEQFRAHHEQRAIMLICLL